MFRGIRLRLTLLYLLAALALIALVAVGTYGLVDNYFQSVTRLGLEHEMAHSFRQYGAALPPELAAADSEWSASRTNLFPSTTDDGHDGRGGGGDDHPSGGPNLNEDDIYNGELAPIFALPLDASGQLIPGPTTDTAPIAPSQDAVATARTAGLDWRTVTLANGTRVRLLTYKLPAGTTPAFVQLGRTLADQDRILSQLLLILLVLGGVSAVLLAIGSWALAGRALRPAQLAWERQQAFIANASHELRTPLTLLRASAEFVQRGLPAADADNRELLGDVLQETDHMSRLVEDLLLLSRLDAGKLKVERQAIPLSDLLPEVGRQVGRVAEEKGVRVEVDGAQGTAWGDPTRLRQVLLILLDNALRYTPAGGRIRLAAQPHGRGVEISVDDTGAGIAPEHLPRLFDRFYRADDSRTGSTGGTGLGLAIAKGLIEAQHGHIALESRPGAGTRVTLTLPASAPAAH